MVDIRLLQKKKFLQKIKVIFSEINGIKILEYTEKKYLMIITCKISDFIALQNRLIQRFHFFLRNLKLLNGLLTL